MIGDIAMKMVDKKFHLIGKIGVNNKHDKQQTTQEVGDDKQMHIMGHGDIPLGTKAAQEDK